MGKMPMLLKRATAGRPYERRKKKRLSVYRRECARSVRKSGDRLQVSDLRKRDKSSFRKDLEEVKKFFKISIFIF
jgi:hypothetical protein